MRKKEKPEKPGMSVQLSSVLRDSKREILPTREAQPGLGTRFLLRVSL